MKNYVVQVLLAIDQLGNTLLGGWADESISSRSWRQRHKKRWNLMRHIVDALFFWQPNHCREAYESERQRLQAPPELRVK